MNKRSKSEHYLALAPRNLFFKTRQRLNIEQKTVKANPPGNKNQIHRKNCSQLSYQNIIESNIKNENQKPNYQLNYQNSDQNKENYASNVSNNPKRKDKSNIHYVKSLRRKSVYQEYKQKIEEVVNSGNNSQQDRNPELKNLKRENESLKNEILNGMNRLRLVREKSEKCLKRVESCKQLKDKIKEQNVRETKKGREQVEKKRKISQIYKERLARIK